MLNILLVLVMSAAASDMSQSDSVSAAGGAATLAGDQVFTGFNQFLGSTTLALNGTNVEIWVTSGSVSKVSTMTVSFTPYVVDAGSASWRIEYQCFYSSANYISGVFNGDKTLDVYSASTHRVALTTVSGMSSGTSAECMQFTAIQVEANTRFAGEIRFKTPQSGLPNQMLYEGVINNSDAGDAGSHYRSYYGGLYENPAGTAITSFAITGHTGSCISTVQPAGNLTCRWDLWRGRSWRP